MKEKIDFLYEVHENGMSTTDIETAYPFVTRRLAVAAMKSGKLRAVRLGSGRGASPWMTTRTEVEKWIGECFVMNK